MKASRTIFIVVTILVAIGLLWHGARQSISLNIIPPLGEFMASSTKSHFAPPPTSYTVLHAPSSVFRITTAKTPTTRAQGLSGRESLASDEGILFIFPEPGVYGFWMKDMNFPIDIVWITSDRKVVGVSPNVLPESYPTTFLPPEKIQFVLEIPAGAAQKAGLEKGANISF